MSDQNDDSTTFLRQRRDLFVISIILLLIPIAEIKSKSDLSIPQLGVSMTIGKPEVILPALWLLWAYWYIRYFQAYKRTSGGYFAHGMHTNTYNIAYQKFLKQSRTQTEIICKEYTNKNKINFNEISIHDGRINSSQVSFFNSWFTWEPSVSIKNRPLGITLPEQKFVIKGLRYVFVRIRAFLSLIFNEMYFTEYYFPFIFGALPAIYWLYTHMYFLCGIFA